MKSKGSDETGQNISFRVRDYRQHVVTNRLHNVLFYGQLKSKKVGSNLERAKPSHNFERAGQRLMYGTAIGDSQKSSELLGVQWAIQLDNAIDMVESDRFLIAILAIMDVIACVSEPNRDALK